MKVGGIDAGLRTWLTRIESKYCIADQQRLMFQGHLSEIRQMKVVQGIRL